MQISGSCCPFFHTAVEEGMVKLNVPTRTPLFLHLDVSRRGTMKRLATPQGRLRWNLHSCSKAASAAAVEGHHTYVPIRPEPAYHPSGVNQELFPVPHHESTHSISSGCRSTAVRAKGMNVIMSAPPMTPVSIYPRDKPYVPWLIIRVPSM
jgi:hypothetical protein